MDAEAQREKVLAGKKKLKKYQKKKAGGGGGGNTNNTSNSTASDQTSPIAARRTSVDSAATSRTRTSSINSETGSVQTEVTVDAKANESKIQVEEISVVAVSSDVEKEKQQVTPGSADAVEEPSLPHVESHSKIVEGHQPIEEPREKVVIPTVALMETNMPDKKSFTAEEGSVTYEDLANICSTQQQTIAVLVEQKSGLTAELDKYTAMADRFKRSEELLEEGQLLVDALRRQNAELEEKIRDGEIKLKEAGDQTERTLETLRLQKARAEKLEKDNNQLVSQLSTKDSIIEQLTAEKAKIRSTSGEVERLTKSLQDKEDRCEALEIELSNIRHRLANTEQQLLDKEEKLANTERTSKEIEAKFESLNNQITSLNTQNTEIKQKLESLQVEHETKSKEAAEHYENLTFKSNVAQELHTERESLTKELQSVQTENTKLTKRIKDITTKIDGLSADNRNLIDQLSELREKVVEISNDKLVLAEQVDREKNRANRLEAELADYRKKYDEISSKQNGNANLFTGDSNSSANQEIQNLEHQLSQLQAAFDLLSKEKSTVTEESSITPPTTIPLYSVDSFSNVTNSVPQKPRRYVPFPINNTDNGVDSRLSPDAPPPPPNTPRSPVVPINNTGAIMEIAGCSGCTGEIIVV
ncbi:5564_t:CDS:2 [Ambispora gerdemannii]|uniref:5564_t:CDS:1 n=1 Tax=Ambispora gerdemannii TaxID=144530 RepID=A0A9N8Z3Y5_9GLOM|nr:5564_t:CDS:2 [Ambispora gerdemannii]